MSLLLISLALLLGCGRAAEPGTCSAKEESGSCGRAPEPPSLSPAPQSNKHAIPDLSSLDRPEFLEGATGKALAKKLYEVRA